MSAFAEGGIKDFPFDCKKRILIKIFDLFYSVYIHFTNPATKFCQGHTESSSVIFN